MNELDKIIEEDRKRFAERLDREQIERRRANTGTLDPNRFPEGSAERELKDGYLADEKIRKEAMKHLW